MCNFSVTGFCYDEGIVLETRVNSFLLRFVQEPAAADAGEQFVWHGVIRHVQSNREFRFTRIEDALRFVNQYVDIVEEAAANDVPGAGSSA